MGIFLKLSVLLCLIFSGIGSVFADSPLTSTPFSTAYKEEPIIQQAIKANGLLTEELMLYLTNENKPIDLKLAVINQLGWQLEGYENAASFKTYLLQSGQFKSEKELLKKGSDEILICLAYLMAMDNYFDVSAAISVAELAIDGEQNHFSIHMIYALIKAQKTLDSNWCEVYRISDGVFSNSKLIMDMKSDASYVIFDYMYLYKESC